MKSLSDLTSKTWLVHCKCWEQDLVLLVPSHCLTTRMFSSTFSTSHKYSVYLGLLYKGCIFVIAISFSHAMLALPICFSCQCFCCFFRGCLLLRTISFDSTFPSTSSKTTCTRTSRGNRSPSDGDEAETLKG